VRALREYNADAFVATYRRVAHSYDDDGGFEAGESYTMLKCPVCAKPTLNRREFDDTMNDEDWGDEILYPSPEREVRGLPDDVRAEYQSAMLVAPVSPNAFGVLLGRVLDKVCTDRRATGSTLSEKLSDLAARGEMPQNLAEMARQLRQLRNLGAHADLGELTADEIPVLKALCTAILEYVYVAPRLVALVEGRVEKLKKKGSQQQTPA
jgi:hypothetical protein